MTSRECVQAAFAHVQPDHVPCDYFGTPEIRQALFNHFGVQDDYALCDRLGSDIRYVGPPYVGPPLPDFDDGSTIDIWGVRRRPMPNEYGEYAESVTLPYAEWTTVEQARRFTWPSPDSYDYQALPALCDRFPDEAIAIGSFGVQDFINGVAFGRGVEQVLLDIALEDPVYLYIVETRHRFFMEVIERTLDAAGGRVDMVLCGDDFGTQRGPLISEKTFSKLFAAKKKELFDLVHAYGAKVSHHCCGSSRTLFDAFIAVGMDAVQTIQPQAEGMDPYALKRDFGDRMTLHGAVDAQGFLQNATPEQIRRKVHRLIDQVGRDGGYILSPSHNIQPDTPLENALAVYRAVAERRGTTRTM